MERRHAAERLRWSRTFTFQATWVPLASLWRPETLHPDRREPALPELITIDQSPTDREIEIPKRDRAIIGDEAIATAHRIAIVPLPYRERVGLVVCPAEQVLHARMEPM